MTLSNKDKLKIYRILGAEKFQKVVFKAEDIKFKIIDKFFPNIINWYDKYCDKIYSIKIKLTKDNKNKIELAEKCKMEKLAIRKEMVYKQNRNYHYNKKYPTEFIHYLQLNKKIHQKGLIRNAIILLGLFLYLLTPLPKSLLLLGTIGGYEVLSAFINFECINLQNYNLCRFNEERIKEKLKITEKKNIDKRIEENISIVKPISEIVIKENEVPMVDDILQNITTKEQVVTLLKYTRKQLEEVKNNDFKNQKVKTLGGK